MLSFFCDLEYVLLNFRVKICILSCSELLKLSVLVASLSVYMYVYFYKISGNTIVVCLFVSKYYR
jgi:hypothetical protein